MKRPLVIAGHASGVGKTTVATGIMGALRRQGFTVAPFKVGPDYIDPGYHQRATGVLSRNLDTWLTSPAVVSRIYARGAAGADIGVIEGVMGLFDGRAGGRDEGSTAEMARLTGAVVVLVADCARLGRSLAPLLTGFDRFDRSIDLAGVILNNVGSPGHARVLRDAAREAGVPVLGEIPRAEGITLGSRQLGLVPESELEAAGRKMESIIDHVGRNVDIEAVAAMAGGAGGGSARDAGPLKNQGIPGAQTGSGPDRPAEKMAAEGGSGKAAPGPNHSGGRCPRIAVARDEAFSFYYADGLEALEAAGAELVRFSPLRDEGLPACEGLYLGGGFPEVFAGQLEANSAMRRSVAAALRAGLPAYAECGGMVYLCRGVEVNGRRREMAGVIDSEARMTGRRQALGYVEARARVSNILMEAGERVRGHEFHWSRVKWQEDRLAYDCFSSKRPEVEQDGFCRGNLLASYVHIHFAGDHGAAARFVEACAGSGRAA